MNNTHIREHAGNAQSPASCAGEEIFVCMHVLSQASTPSSLACQMQMVANISERSMQAYKDGNLQLSRPQRELLCLHELARVRGVVAACACKIEPVAF